MTRRIPLTISEEYDALTRWRRSLTYLGRPGVCHRIKRGYRRRERRVGKEQIRRGDD